MIPTVRDLSRRERKSSRPAEGRSTGVEVARRRMEISPSHRRIPQLLDRWRVLGVKTNAELVQQAAKLGLI